MSGASGKWREDQILVICPGSKTTMAQMGCAELTPPAHRIPTRMFKDDEGEGYRPYHVEKRKKTPAQPANGAAPPSDKEEDEWEYIEDPDATEGAIYPIKGGRIVDMHAFLAFLDHVHSLLTTTYHNTPIILMASSQWTRPDCEAITRYIFEKTKTPALCMINSAVATQYGLKWPSMTVVDIGFEKVDVTCMYDSRIVNHEEVGNPVDENFGDAISGGEVFTRRLQALLKDKDFTYEMSEQLKKSPICEVLPYAAENPLLVELPRENASAVAAVPAPDEVLQAAQEAPSTLEPAKPPITTADVEDVDGAGEEKAADQDDGVLDVASIVTSGQTKEFLAKKEKEKTEKQKGKKGAKGQENDASGKGGRLPNSKRMKATFHYEEVVREEAPVLIEADLKPPTETTNPTATVQEDTSASNGATGGEGSESLAKPADDSAPAPTAPNGEAKEPEAKPADAGLSFFPSDSSVGPVPTTTERAVKRIRRDIEVGLERFNFADRAEIDRIVAAIYKAVQGIDDMYMRPPCWEHLVFVGNGARVRGLKENILQTLNSRFLVSPSTATMFTSELPSNLATPTGTGSQTPTGSFTGPPHQLPAPTSGVNPLLRDAVTAASMGHTGTPGGAVGTNAPGSNAGDGGAVSSHFHSQTPTSIKLATLPGYLGEWTKNGYEESMFLGAQVAARLAFCMHNLSAAEAESQRLMSLNRIEFNEYGPKAIRTHSMLGQ